MASSSPSTSKLLATLTQVPVEGLFGTEAIRSIQPNGPIPLYHQLYLIIRNRIVSGRLVAGTMLPPETGIANKVSVSRITVQKALRLLVEDGLLARKRGIGSYVIFDRSETATHTDFDSDPRDWAHRCERSTTSVLVMEERRIPGQIARRYFGIDESIDAFYVSRIRFNKFRQPFAFYESWTPGARFNMSKDNFETQTRVEVLERLGIVINHAIQSLNAAVPSERAAELLELSVTDPVLTLQRRSFDSTGKNIDYLFVQYHPGRFEFASAIGDPSMVENSVMSSA